MRPLTFREFKDTLLTDYRLFNEINTLTIQLMCDNDYVVDLDKHKFKQQHDFFAIAFKKYDRTDPHDEGSNESINKKYHKILSVFFQMMIEGGVYLSGSCRGRN